MKRILVFLLLITTCVTVNAQSRADIFNKTEVAWLGLDFTQVNFIGTAAQWQDAGEISSEQLREKYFVSWNELFVNEKEKYNISDKINRGSVEYALEVTATANSKSSRDYFTDDAGSLRHLDRKKINSLISKYNFKGKKGLGMMFMVEGMGKEAKKASMWVVFVNMGSKKVLLAERIEGKAGGFGFRNYWAKSFYNGLKAVDANFKKWKNK